LFSAAFGTLSALVTENELLAAVRPGTVAEAISIDTR
jgi:hypothetical protein